MSVTVVQQLRVCRVTDLTPDRGVAAIVAGEQIALFRISSADPSARDEVFAIGNRDPFSGAQVMSRGIVGDVDGVPKVASPLYKQNFDLRTGRCIDDDGVSLPTFPVCIKDGWVEVVLAT